MPGRTLTRELQQQPDGRYVAAAGAVIARQRPGTTLGCIFLFMEDENGIANLGIHPRLYERERMLVTRGKFLKTYGKLQNERWPGPCKSRKAGSAPGSHRSALARFSLRALQRFGIYLDIQTYQRRILLLSIRSIEVVWQT
jgi:hypothetical protein